MSKAFANRTLASLTRMGQRIGICAWALACLLSASAAMAEPTDLKVRPFELLPGQAEVRIGRLQFVAGLELSSPNARFGGLSGLLVEPGSDRLIAVSDRGSWFTARLQRAADGRLTGLEQAELHPMFALDGRSSLRGYWIDAEALTREPGGGLVVAFEHQHRLWRYAPVASLATAVPQALTPPSDLKQAPDNGGIEALTALPSGELLAIAEEHTDDEGNLLAWLGRSGEWRRLRYRPTGSFRPTDLALLPTGDVLVLERRFSVLGGVAARLVRLSAATIRPGALLEGEEIARLERPLELDNFEGLAVVADADGSLWLYLVSDDNFSLLQRTLLLQFRLLD